MKTSPNQNANNIVRSLCSIAIAFTCVVFLTASNANAQGMNEIKWLTNVEQAKQIAAKQNKLVLLHFDASWSRRCKSLDTYVFRSAAVKKTIAENVVPVKLDADRELNLVNEYDVAMVPFDIVITPGGRVISERRSPADADNFAKMIAGTSTASRMLDKEKMGPIAHQRTVVKNQTLKGQNPADFRVDGPSHDQYGLSKDGDLLQRRQNAFNNDNSIRKSNPFVKQASNDDALLASSANNATVSVQDLERDQFLSRERDWVAPSMETRRAKPQRIINDRYFQSIAKKQKPVQMENNQNAPKPGPFSLASSSREVTLEPAATQDDTGFDLQLDANTKAASHQVPQSGGSIHGDFQVQPATQNMINNVVQVGPLTTDPQTVAPQTVAPQTVAPQRPGLVDLNPKTPMLDRFKVSLKGKCPVTLMTEGRWVDGDSKFGIVHRNRTYIFASAEKLAIFRSYPDKFSPMLAGYDPVVYHEQGKLVEGLVENGIFMGQMPEQQVVLFQDAATRAKFQASPKTYLETIRQATNSSDQKTMR